MASDSTFSKDRKSVLVVDEDPRVINWLEPHFSPGGMLDHYDVTFDEVNEVSLQHLREGRYQILLVGNFTQPGGLKDLLGFLQLEATGTAPILLLTDEHVSQVMEAFKLGVVDLIAKEALANPEIISRLDGMIQRALNLSERRQAQMVRTQDMFSPVEELHRLSEMLESRLVDKEGMIQDMMLLSQDGLVMDHLTRREGDAMDMDLLGGMFTVLRQFMQDTVKAGERENLSDIKFGAWQILFERGEWCDLVVIFSGNLPANARVTLRLALATFELHNQEVLPRWKGNRDDIKGARDLLEGLHNKLEKLAR